MPKKKIRQKYQADPSNSTDTSDDENQSQLKKCCPHITKAVSVAGIKKALKTGFNFGECQMCQKSRKEKTTEDAEGDELLVDDSTWLCLLCGHQGCGRNSFQHSLQHYKTPHSDVHALVANSTSWAIWCYECDDEVSAEASRRLAECVDFVRRQVGLAAIKKESQSSSVKPDGIASCTVVPENDKQRLTDKASTEKGRAATKNVTKPLNGLVDTSLPKVKGLTNLGNTCFFNAVMQNLVQSKSFVDALQSHGQENAIWCLPSESITDLHSLNEVPLPECGTLTQALLEFLNSMTLQGKNGISSPSKLFGQVCKKAPQFRGFQQQDSHELLRQLLDGIRMEEIRRQKRGILRAFGISEKVKNGEVDEDLRKTIKAYSRQASHTIVDKVFGGQLVSTVLCEECQQPSQVIEAFMDLSLPVGEEKPTRPGLQRRSLSCDEPSECLGRKGKKDDDAPSKYQSKKMKKQARKEARKNVKAAKVSSSKLNVFAEKNQETEQLNSKDGSDDEDLSGNDLTDADVEDNDETETSSRHSQSCQTQMEDSSAPETKQSDNKAPPVQDAVDPIQPTSRINEAGDLEASALDKESGNGQNSNEQEKVITESLPYNICDIQNQEVSPTDVKEFVSETTLDSLDPTVLDGSVTKMDVENFNVSSEVLLKTSESQDFLQDAESKLEGELCTEMQGLCIDASAKIRKLSIRRKSESKDSLLETPEEKVLNGVGDDAISPLDENSTDSGIGNGEKMKHKKRTRQISLDSRTLGPECLAKMLTTLATRYQPASHECSIMSCLHQFTMLELLSGNNKFGCENCTRIKAAKSADKESKTETVYSNASKQLLILCPPSTLTLHLKRFQQVGMSLKKVNKFVEFPLVLDLAPFCSSLALGLKHVNEGHQQVLYSLYGVVEHSGRLTGGHYTAFVKVRKTWNNKASYTNDFPIGLEEIDHLKSEMFRKYIAQDNSTCVPEACSATLDEGNEHVWYHVSDSHVSLVPESTVLRCQAYLLFYDRIM